MLIGLSLIAASLGLTGLATVNTIRDKNTQTFSDLSKHTYIVGTTGTGKSTFVNNMFIDRLEKYPDASHIFLIYKDQDSADDLLDSISDEFKDRVIYIDPSNMENFIGFNIFGNKYDSKSLSLYVNSMIDIFKTIWGSAIGASTEDILRMVGLAVAEQQIRTPLEIYKSLLGGKGIKDVGYYYRMGLIDNTKNLIAKNFMENELPKKIDSYQAISPPRNKLRKLVSDLAIRYTLCQSNPKLNLEQAINDGKIIICNFNQEKLGSEIAEFLSAFFLAQVQIVSFTREHKTPLFLNLDEFASYCSTNGSSSLEKYLSQARSFNVALTLAHQYMKQVDEKIINAIDGNVASRYFFRIGQKDYKILKDFIGDFNQDDLTKMQDYYNLKDILVNGKKKKMVIKKAPKPCTKYNNREYIIENSIKKYSTHKNILEDDIRNRLGLNKDKGNVASYKK